MTSPIRFASWRALAVGAAALLFSLVPPRPAQAETGAIERYALLVGSNDGGSGRVRLRYATSDAVAMERVLTTLGGIERDHVMLLLEPDKARMEQALAETSRHLQRARAVGRRAEVVVYYSGHSDEDGLLPSGNRLSWGELRRHLTAMPAAVRIAIVDSCASGSLLRAKGGQKRAPFLLDASSQVTGHAYLTSSSADEAAQESDGIGGSFFTHHLVTGLRGAADTSGDRRVTLAEAYQFAFHQTLARTEATQRGPQHPNYDFDLAGSGDVVITDLAAVSCVLAFDRALAGRLFVRDGAGRLVAEIDKTAGRSVELGLEAGTWRVALQQPARMALATVVLGRGQRVEVQSSLFAAQPLSVTRARGQEGPEDVDVELSQDATDVQMHFPPTQTTRLSFGLVPVAEEPAASTRADPLAISLIGGLHHSVHGIDAAGVFTMERHGLRGVQAAGAFNLNGGPVHGTQVAGAFNLTGGRVDGVQVAGAFNLARAPLRGVQTAGGCNIASGGSEGVQAAGGCNLATAGSDGVQVAGGMNFAGQTSRGVQIAGGVNVATRMEGTQVGTVNIAGKIRGLQIGVVNIASELDGEAIGLVSLIGNGYRHVEVWGSDTTYANLGLKLGGRHLYTLFAAGAGTVQGPDNWTLGIGLGGHADLRHLYVDFDVLGASPHKGGDFSGSPRELLAQARLTLGAPIGRAVAVFAGLSYHATLGFSRAPPATSHLPEGRIHHLGDDVQARFGPGLVAGIRL